MKEYFIALKQYFNFHGRATRKEFWMFLFYHGLIIAAFAIVDFIIDFRHESGLGFLSSVYSLLTFIPSFVVHVRRLHDVDRSGWWTLLHFTAVGSLVLFFFNCTKSVPYDNKWGNCVKS